MGLLAECLAANERYAASFDRGELPAPPAKRLAVLTCMDARILPDRILGLNIGDAHYIRNAGGLVTDDALRSLIIAHTLLGVDQFFVINHTGCGMQRPSDDEIRAQVASRTGVTPTNVPFLTFSDLEATVREQTSRIKSCPYITGDAIVHGFVYQVEDGRLRQVV